MRGIAPPHTKEKSFIIILGKLIPANAKAGAVRIPTSPRLPSVSLAKSAKKVPSDKQENINSTVYPTCKSKLPLKLIIISALSDPPVLFLFFGILLAKNVYTIKRT